MLSLKSLTFQNIGRFIEEQTIDFSSLGSLVKIEGQNLNTSGSSGAGKSTIFKAIDFLLGINDVSTGVLQSRFTKEPLSVTGTFDFDGLPLKIQRGKKLLIDLNGEVTTGSSKLTEEKLDQIIGMPRDLFRKILHKRQGEGGFFLDMGGSDTHKFLTDCLGLGIEQAKITTLDARLATLETDRMSSWHAVETLTSAIEATDRAIATLPSLPTLEFTPEAVERLRLQFLEASEAHELAKEAHKAELAELEKTRPQISSVPYDRSKIAELEGKIEVLQKEIHSIEQSELGRQYNAKEMIAALHLQISKLNNQELARQNSIKVTSSKISLDIMKAGSAMTEGERAKREATVLAQDLQKIKNSLCPTCEQGWINDTIKAKEADILNKLKEYKNLVILGIQASKDYDALKESKKQLDLDALPKEIPEVLVIKGEIAQYELEAQPQKPPGLSEWEKLLKEAWTALKTEREAEKAHQFTLDRETQAILVIYAQKQTELRKKHEDAVSIVRQAEYDAQSTLKSALASLTSFHDQKKKLEESLTKLNNQKIKYENDLKSSSYDLQKVQEEVELATEAKKAIKSYLSCSFEDALDSIGDTATRFIRSIPNMQTATIQFEGLKENKDGKVKEEVTCIISMDGEVGIPVKSLSGGERSSTDLAIDLAVIKFIEERTGLGVSFLALDEPFTGLDSKNIVDAIEMLRECSIDKQLLIVDHCVEASQFIENRLTVVRDGLTSNIIRE